FEEHGAAAYSLYLSYASNFVFPDGSFSEPEKEKPFIVSKQEIKKIKKETEKNMIDYQSHSDEESEEEDENNEESEEESDKSEEENIKQKTKEKKVKKGFDKYVNQ